MAKKRVVVIYPGKYPSSKEIGQTLPMGPLAVLTYLKNKGINVEFFDARHKDISELNLDNVILVGLNAFTGGQITQAVDIAKIVRDKNPSIPLVWGGIHSSLYPKQTIQSKYVDMIVVGEGEETFYELVKALENKTPLNDVKGLLWKEKNGDIHINESRPLLDIENLPFTDFSLLGDLGKYNLDWVSIGSSRGCPHRCTFCFEVAFYKFKWRSKSAIKTVDEIQDTIKKVHPKNIFFNDDLFFVNKKRVEDICQEIIKRGLNKECCFGGNCRLDYLARYEDEFLQLLKDANFKYLNFGGESGSQKILDYVKKDLKIEETLKAAEKLKKFDFIPTISFVIGTPLEKREDLMETVKLVDSLMKIDPRANLILFIFNPYPGTPMYEEAIKSGFKEPDSFEGWGQYAMFNDAFKLPWLGKDDQEVVQCVSNCMELISTHSRPKWEWDPKFILRYVAKSFLISSAKIRWKYKFFEYPLEILTVERLYNRKLYR